MDGVVDAPAAEEGGVCCVDDAGCRERGYGGADEADFGVESWGGRGEGVGWVCGGIWGVEGGGFVEGGEGGDLGEVEGGGHFWVGVRW